MALSNDVSEVLVTPVANMITRVAQSVADAQIALDRSSIAMTKLAAEDPELKAIGYQPAFYVIPEMVVELKMNLHLESKEQAPVGKPPRLLFQPVSASTVRTPTTTVVGDGSSSLKIRVVPIPAPVTSGESKP